jgi:hypothetical protein
MSHPSEDQLVLHYYGEAPELGDHLAGCAECRSRYEVLQRVFAAVNAAPVPERGEDYGKAVWERVRHGVPRRSGFRWADLFLHPPRWAVAGAMAVLLVCAFLAGRFWPRAEGPRTATTNLAGANRVRERILLVAVGDHLEQSQMVLVELVNSKGNGPMDISAEQERAEDLLDANRLYRQTAATAGETAMASVLDDLERTLLEIAHSPSTISSREFDEIRSRIESEGIIFKIRVVGSNVRGREMAAMRQ